jgi:hypothetical protein
MRIFLRRRRRPPPQKFKSPSRVNLAQTRCGFTRKSQLTTCEVNVGVAKWELLWLLKIRSVTAEYPMLRGTLINYKDGEKVSKPEISANQGSEWWLQVYVPLKRKWEVYWCAVSVDVSTSKESGDYGKVNCSNIVENSLKVKTLMTGPWKRGANLVFLKCPRGSGTIMLC